MSQVKDRHQPTYEGTVDATEMKTCQRHLALNFRLTRLTTLHLAMLGDLSVLQKVQVPPSVVDVDVVGGIRTTALEALVASLPELQPLKLHHIYAGMGNTCALLTLPLVSDSLR